MSDVAIPVLTKIEDLFKDLVWDNLVKTAITALFAYVPWLNVPVIRQAVEYILKLFAEKIYDVTKLCVDVSAIVIVNEVAQKEYARASVKLRIIAHEKGIQSEEFKKEKENAKASFAKFVQFNAVK